MLRSTRHEPRINLQHKTCDSIWYWISPVWARLMRLPKKLKIFSMQQRSFRLMARNKLDSLLQFVKSLRKVENLMECPTTVKRVVARGAEAKCTNDSDFNPSVLNNESLVDTAIGVVESATRKFSVRLNKSTGCCANWCCFFSENGRYCCVKWCCFVAGSSPCCVK